MGYFRNLALPFWVLSVLFLWPCSDTILLSFLHTPLEKLFHWKHSFSIYTASGYNDSQLVYILLCVIYHVPKSMNCILIHHRNSLASHHGGHLKDIDNTMENLTFWRAHFLLAEVFDILNIYWHSSWDFVVGFLVFWPIASVFEEIIETNRLHTRLDRT